MKGWAMLAENCTDCQVNKTKGRSFDSYSCRMGAQKMRMAQHSHPLRVAYVCAGGHNFAGRPPKYLKIDPDHMSNTNAMHVSQVPLMRDPKTQDRLCVNCQRNYPAGQALEVSHPMPCMGLRGTPMHSVASTGML